jgi:hypothetical protein
MVEIKDQEKINAFIENLNGINNISEEHKAQLIE